MSRMRRGGGRHVADGGRGEHGMTRRRRVIYILARVSVTVLLLLFACTLAAWMMSYRRGDVRSAPANGGWHVQSLSGVLDISRYQPPVPGLLPMAGAPPSLPTPAPAMGVFIVSPHL